MLVRRVFFGWMLPAAVVLPLWLLVGWAVTGAGAWAFLWVLFLAIPGVIVWQLLITLLVRARGTVRAHRAVSWQDVLGLALWHGLVIALGFFSQDWWGATFVIAILAGLGLFWSTLWQLWREARPTGLLRTADIRGYMTVSGPRAQPTPPQEIIVVSERQEPGGR
jgi:hypothetical protein